MKVSKIYPISKQDLIDIQGGTDTSGGQTPPNDYSDHFPHNPSVVVEDIII